MLTMVFVEDEKHIECHKTHPVRMKYVALVLVFHKLDSDWPLPPERKKTNIDLESNPTFLLWFTLQHLTTTL